MPRPFLPFLFLAALATPTWATPAPASDAPLYRTVTRTYHTDSYYLKGLLKRELTADATARPYLETEQTYVPPRVRIVVASLESETWGR